MTRFQRELSGELGEFWKNDAEKRLDKVRAELAEAGPFLFFEWLANSGFMLL